MRCATRRATSRTTRWRTSISISRRMSARVTAQGGARALCRHRGRTPARSSSTSAARLGAKTVTKGKSMIAEEIGLNDFLEANGDHAGRNRSRRIHHPDPPRDAVAHHRAGGASHARRRSRPTSAACTPICRRIAISTSRTALLAEARAVLREKFLAADVGITGANFLVAETGTSIIVTNEGNGDLTQTLPKVAHRARLDREARADARGRGAAPARAGALGDRSGNVGLHDAVDRPAPPRRSRRPAASITSSCSTTAARPCSAASSATCSAASAAAPA